MTIQLDDPLVYWHEKHKQELAARNARVERAAADFDTANYTAAEHGLTLCCESDYHYHLWGPDDNWLINIYPERNRLHSPTWKRGPFLRLSGEWGLIDVVLAAVDAEGC